MKRLVIVTIAVLLSGCQDKYQQGYETGYVDGVQATENKWKEVVELQTEKIERLEGRNTFNSGVHSTEVCGGGGVNVNGKHHGPGETGCVRAYNDGRIEKY